MFVNIIRQSEIADEFATIPATLTDPFRAVIIGPNYFTLLYTNAADKANAYLGEYDELTADCFNYPNLPAGGIVDQSFTALYIENALLRYAAFDATDNIKGTFCDGAVELYNASAVAKNLIRSDTIAFKTENGFTRDAALYERDVQIGDVIKLSYGGNDFWSTVTNILYEYVPGVVEAAYEDENNVGADLDGTSGSSSSMSATPGTITKIGFATNDIELTAVDVPTERLEANYQDGLAEDLYTFTVISGGDETQAVIRITTDSGTDDVAEFTPLVFGSPVSFGSKGLSATFTNVSDEFEVGMVWTVAVQFAKADVDAVSGGTYDGTTDTTYIITVTRGGLIGGTTPAQITVTTANGSDASGPHNVLALDTEIAIGSRGVTIKFVSAITDNGLFYGDKYYIPVEAAGPGRASTLVLADNIPDAMLGIVAGVCGVAPEVNATLYIEKNIEVSPEKIGFAPDMNWEADETQLCVSAGMIAYDDSWIDGSGDLLPLNIESGALYISYRALLGAATGELQTMDDLESISTLGAVTPDNPLAYGVYMALLNSNGVPVHYIGIEEDTPEGWETALQRIGTRDGVYTLVPMTFDNDILDVVVDNVVAQSGATGGNWRTAVICSEVTRTSELVTEDIAGNPILATISDNPADAIPAYTLVTCANNPGFIAAGVRAGDRLRTGYTTDGFGNVEYDEYVVDSVVANDVLVLRSGPSAPVVVAQKIEVWRTLTTAEYASAVAAIPAAYSSELVCNIWPDYFEKDGESLPGYYLAAAVAGLRSTCVQHRSLSRVELFGADGVSKSYTGFTQAQLDTIAAAGTYVISQTASGDVFTLRAWTTNVASVAKREEVLTRNIHGLLYAYAYAVAPFIGIVNITTQMIARITNVLEDTSGYVLTNTVTDALGPAAETLELISLQQHPTISDRLIATITADLPTPFNTLQVGITGTNVSIQVVI